jgi:hypothetical protein
VDQAGVVNAARLPIGAEAHDLRIIDLVRLDGFGQLVIPLTGQDQRIEPSALDVQAARRQDRQVDLSVDLGEVQAREIAVS